jgi:hypothetical protein
LALKILKFRFADLDPGSCQPYICDPVLKNRIWDEHPGSVTLQDGVVKFGVPDKTIDTKENGLCACANGSEAFEIAFGTVYKCNESKLCRFYIY